MRHSSHLHLHFHTHHRAARYDVDMTKGSITKHLINFALPLMVGNLFQQLYNMVDTWVVGNYVSNEAFSAVGTVTPIINTLIGFFLGLSSGAGVVISQYSGAGREDKVRQAVHPSLVLTLLMGAVFTAAGIAMTPLMLRLMKTPAEVAPEQTTYLTIYFAGVMGLLLYNMGSGILRAVGDSRRGEHGQEAASLRPDRRGTLHRGAAEGAELRAVRSPRSCWCWRRALGWKGEPKSSQCRRGRRHRP